MQIWMTGLARGWVGWQDIAQSCSMYPYFVGQLLF